MASNTPIETIRDGSLKATIWQDTGESGPFYSRDHQGAYRDADGQWQDSRSFTSSDLLRVAHLATVAYGRTTALRQADKASAS